MRDSAGFSPASGLGLSRPPTADVFGCAATLDLSANAVNTYRPAGRPCYAGGMDPSDFCVLDVESAGGAWSSFPQGFDLLLTGVRYGADYYAFTADPASLSQMVDSLEGFQGVVATFNGDFFDLPLLDDHCGRLLGRPLRVLHHYDLLKEIQKKAGLRVSLERVSLYTFGDQKMPWDHRHNRRVWLEEPHRLIEYNRRDLDLTHEMYRRVLSHQHLFLGNATVLLPLPGEPAS